jgi:hypothetical protein
MVENKNTFTVFYHDICGVIRYISGESGNNLVTNNNSSFDHNRMKILIL